MSYSTYVYVFNGRLMVHPYVHAVSLTHLHDQENAVQMYEEALRLDKYVLRSMIVLKYKYICSCDFAPLF